VHGRREWMSLLELLISLAVLAAVERDRGAQSPAMRPGSICGCGPSDRAGSQSGAHARRFAENMNHRIVFVAARRSNQHQRKPGTGYVIDGAPVALPRGIVVSDCPPIPASVSGTRQCGHIGTVSIANTQGNVRRIIVDIAGQIRVQ